MKNWKNDSMAFPMSAWTPVGKRIRDKVWGQTERVTQQLVLDGDQVWRVTGGPLQVEAEIQGPVWAELHEQTHTHD